ncbi:hypothetical protein LCGC14_0724270 [marine sediment metagenome]|uniref:Uncharacterized protein n=1 Tax=marine sediment metagenome TaxID=412755 RepID=A0A0F9QBI1_9ZZZZ
MEFVARMARKVGVALGKPIVVRDPREVAILDELVRQERTSIAAFNATQKKRAGEALQRLGLFNGYASGRIERRQDGSYLVHKG